jgi:hypothetical protein
VGVVLSALCGGLDWGWLKDLVPSASTMVAAVESDGSVKLALCVQCVSKALWEAGPRGA